MQKTCGKTFLYPWGTDGMKEICGLWSLGPWMVWKGISLRQMSWVFFMALFHHEIQHLWHGLTSTFFLHNLSCPNQGTLGFWRWNGSFYLILFFYLISCFSEISKEWVLCEGCIPAIPTLWEWERPVLGYLSVCHSCLPFSLDRAISILQFFMNPSKDC